VLVSYGPNGHGAFPRNGAALTSRISFGSINSDEQKNCDCSNSSTNNPTIPGGTYVQKLETQEITNHPDQTNDFDDIVAFGNTNAGPWLGAPCASESPGLWR
jgi:hypothetical protein